MRTRFGNAACYFDVGWRRVKPEHHILQLLPINQQRPPNDFKSKALIRLVGMLEDVN